MSVENVFEATNSVQTSPDSVMNIDWRESSEIPQATESIPIQTESLLPVHSMSENPSQEIRQGSSNITSTSSSINSSMQQNLTSTSTSTPSLSENTVTGSEDSVFKIPANKKWREMYLMIVNVPQPRAVKRRRLQDLYAYFNAKRMRHHKQKTPSSSDSSISNPRRSHTTESGNNTADENTIVRSQETQQSSPVMAEIDRRRALTPDSSLSSQEDPRQHDNGRVTTADSSLDRLPTGLIAQTRAPTDDGNAHSNVAAPRRVQFFVAATSSRDERDTSVDIRTFGG